MAKNKKEKCVVRGWFDRLLLDFSVEEDVAPILEGVFVFPADFPGFTGHFPNEPVLPAVLQLMVVRLLAEKALKMELIAGEVQRVKFSGVIRPEEKVVFSIKITEKTKQWVADFSIRRHDQSAAAGTVIFRSR